jgi:ketosteroid isomerase-like protein
VLPEGGVNAGTNHGRESFRAFFESYFEAFASIQIEPVRIAVAGDRIVALLRISGAGRESGAEVEQLAGHIWTMRDGTAARLEIVSGHQETLEAAGLVE